VSKRERDGERDGEREREREIKLLRIQKKGLRDSSNKKAFISILFFSLLLLYLAYGGYCGFLAFDPLLQLLLHVQ
jgi:hypothetical protein